MEPTRLLGPWDFPGRNTGVDCHFLFQGIFLTPRFNPCPPHLLYWQADSLPLSHLGNPKSPKLPLNRHLGNDFCHLFLDFLKKKLIKTGFSVSRVMRLERWISHLHYWTIIRAHAIPKCHPREQTRYQ